MPKWYRLSNHATLTNTAEWKPLKIYRLNSGGAWELVKTIYRLGNHPTLTDTGQWQLVHTSQAAITVTTPSTLLNQISSPDTFYGGDTLTLTRGAYTNTTADSNTSYRMTIYKSINSGTATSGWTVVTRQTFTGANSTAATTITGSVTDLDAKDKYYFVGEIRVNNDANTVGSDTQDFETPNKVLSRISFDTSSFSVNKASTSATFEWVVTGVPAPDGTTNYLYQDASNTASIVRITRNPQTTPAFQLDIPAGIASLNGTATTVGFGTLESDKPYRASLIIRANDGWATDSNFTKNNKGAVTLGATYLDFITPLPEPINTVVPVVSTLNNRGRAPVETTLTATQGTWTNVSGTTVYEYQWTYSDGISTTISTWSTNNTLSSIPASYAADGSVSVKVRATNTDGGNKTVQSIAYLLDPVVAITVPTPTTVDASASNSFGFTVSGYPTSYSIDWTNDGIVDFNQPSVTSNTASVNVSQTNTYSTTGTYTLRLRAQPGNIVRDTTITVTPAAFTYTVTNPSSISPRAKPTQLRVTDTNDVVVDIGSSTPAGVFSDDLFISGLGSQAFTLNVATVTAVTTLASGISYYTTSTNHFYQVDAKVNVTGLTAPISATITAASWASNLVTYTANNNFTNGQAVIVTGSSNTAYNITGIVSGRTVTSFQLSLATNPGVFSGSATASTPNFNITNGTLLAGTSGNIFVVNTGIKAGSLSAQGGTSRASAFVPIQNLNQYNASGQLSAGSPYEHITSISNTASNSPLVFYVKTTGTTRSIWANVSTSTGAQSWRVGASWSGALANTVTSYSNGTGTLQAATAGSVTNLNTNTMPVKIFDITGANNPTITIDSVIAYQTAGQIGLTKTGSSGSPIQLLGVERPTVLSPEDSVNYTWLSPTASTFTTSDQTATPSAASGITVTGSTNNIATVNWTNGTPITSVNVTTTGAGSSINFTDSSSPFDTSTTGSYTSSASITATVVTSNTNGVARFSWNQTNAKSYSINATINGSAANYIGNASGATASHDFSVTTGTTVTINNITVYTAIDQKGTSNTFSVATSRTPAVKTSSATGSGSVTYTTPQYTVTWNATNQGGTGGGTTTQNVNVAHTAPTASKNSFTVSYGSSGHTSGSPPSNSQAIYNFRGYYNNTDWQNATLGPIALGGSFTPTSSITMYAVWLTTSASITLPQPGMTRTGYTFGGWQIGIVIYDAGTSYTPTANTTATAIWTANAPNNPTLLTGYPKQLGVNATSNMTIGATFDATATSVLVEYGTTTNYGSSFNITTSGNTGQTTNYAIGTTIFYRLKSYNSTTLQYSSGITGSYTTVAKVTSVTASQSSTAPFVTWSVNTHGMKSMRTYVYKSTTVGGNTFATGGSDPILSANTVGGSQTRITNVTPGGVGYKYYLQIFACYTGDGGTGSTFDTSRVTDTFTHANGAFTTVYTAP